MNPILERERRDDGFVLIGVVIIVLALTILGISLFGLSGYEAQFLGASASSSRAFYTALGGIDRTRLALSATEELGAAGSNLPPGVIYARARQGADSTDAVDWQDTTRVEILVTAEINGIRRTIEASFRPNRDRTLYTDLIATTQNLHIRHTVPNPGSQDVHRDHCDLNGKLRHNGDLNAGEAPPAIGSYTDEGNGVPDPQVAAYFSGWLPLGTAPSSYTPGSPDVYRFDVPDDGFAHFVNGLPGPGGGFGLHNLDRVEIQVNGRGTAIWMLPAGARFEQRVEVTGTGDARLVIVAGVTADTTEFFRTGANKGLWFGGGIHSDQVPVILVSDGSVAIEHYSQHDESDYVTYLSVFAKGFVLARHVDASELTVLNHNEGRDEEVLNPLYDDGLLPNTLPGRGQDFLSIAGSWREIPQ